MTDPRSTPTRRATWAIGAAAIVAVGVRLVALVGIGALRHPINFDEGAYFTTAALWARGATLYGDVTAVHPPGATYVFAPLTWIGAPSTAFVTARVVMTIVGGLNAWLVGSLARRFAPTWAAVTAVVIYALLPDAVLAERSVIIEPLLNLACLGAATVWLRGVAQEQLRSAFVAGALVGVALSFKVWGAFLVVPMAATAPRPIRRQAIVRVAAGASSALALLVALPLASSPKAFIDQVVLFQLSRHDGEPTTLVGRLLRVLPDPRHVTSTRPLLLAAVCVLAVLLLRRSRPAVEVRFAFIWAATVAFAFVVAPIHSSQYNTHLAPAVALLGAWVATEFRERLRTPTQSLRLAAVAAVAVVTLAVVQSAWNIGTDAGDRSQDPTSIRSVLRPLPECIFSFEAGWLLVADRLPDPDLVGPGAADIYVTALIASNRSGRGPEQLRSTAARDVFRRAVTSCDTVLLGPRGRWHMGTDLVWFEKHFRKIADEVDGAPDVWQFVG